MDKERYFSRSWEMLTHDKGWFKPLLVMMCAQLVPIAGALGCKGYALEWARLVAWGVDSHPKQKNVQVGACIASGWRGFVIDVGWMVILVLLSLFTTLLANVISGIVGFLIMFVLSLLMLVVGTFWATIVSVAEVRGAIYERIGAGYRVDRVFQMIRRDMHGFLRVFLVFFLSSLVLSLVGSVLTSILGLELLPTLIASQYDNAATSVVSALAGSLVWIVLTGALIFFALGFIGAGIRLITLCTTGLWMRQFDVPSWGKSSDPLPDEVSDAVSALGPAEVTATDEPTQPDAGVTHDAAAVRRDQPTSVPASAQATQVAQTPEDRDALIDQVWQEVSHDPIEEGTLEELRAAVDELSHTGERDGS